MTIPIRGTAALVVPAIIVAVTLIWLPAYRLFFLISLGVAVVVPWGCSSGTSSVQSGKMMFTTNGHWG